MKVSRTLAVVLVLVASCYAQFVTGASGTGGAGGSGAINLVIPAVNILTTTLPGCLAGAPYSATLLATGGVTPYKWTLSAGALPTGLTLSQSGQITGTCGNNAAVYNFTVMVADASTPPLTAQQPLSISVGCPPITMNSPSQLPSAIVGTGYNYQMQTLGGVAPINWVLTGGALPPGESISGSGLIAGTPTTPGPFTFTLKASDSCPLGSQSVSGNFSEQVNPTSFGITTTSVANKTVGQPFTGQFAASGGVTPYGWTTLIGLLPAGLFLDAATGVESGTPSLSQSATYTIMALDHANNIVQNDDDSLTGWSQCYIGHCNGGSPGGTNPPQSVTQQVITAQPNLDGNSMQMSFVANLPNTNVLYVFKFASDPNAFRFVRDFWFYWSGNANQLEMDIFHFLNPTEYMFGTQCNFTAGVWDTFDQGSLMWVHSTRTCTMANFAPNVWHHIVQVDRINGLQQIYESLTVDGIYSAWNITANSGPLPNGFANVEGVQNQCDQANPGTCNMYVDQDKTIVSDTGGNEAQAQFTQTASCVPLMITTTAIPNGQQGQMFSFQMTSQGGFSPLIWSATGFPAPVGISSSGLISGIPGSAGSFPVDVQVTDSCPGQAQSDNDQFTWVVNPTQSALQITTPNPLNTATEGQSFQQQMNATGGVPPYLWALINGTTLPAGLSMNSAGLISGTATLAGTSNPDIQVHDQQPVFTDIVFQITVSCPAQAITTSSLNSGTVGTAFSQTMQAAGGILPLTWSASGLPPGLAINASTGAITGTPTTPGTFTPTISVTDSCAPTGTLTSVQFTQIINPQALAITTTSPLPSGSVGQQYSITMAAIGGVLPYQWTLTSGTLPAGLSLALNGTISGLPTQAQTVTVTIQVADNGGHTASGSFSITINGPNTCGFDGPAQLPCVFLVTSVASTPSPGAQTPVPSGGNLQTALNNANCGDTLLLAAGATFTGAFTFPNKPCDDGHWITVRSSTANASMPPEGTRLLPCYSGVASQPELPPLTCPVVQNLTSKINWDGTGGGIGPIKFASGANHYRLMFLEVTENTGIASNFGLFTGAGSNDKIIVDRTWAHGTKQDDLAKGFDVTGFTNTSVIDSFFSDMHCQSVQGAGCEGHAIGGGLGSHQDGPFKFVHNFLEAGGQGILLGGGPATLTPQDIEVRYNHFFKPLVWLKGQPGFIGGINGYPFTVKNNFELKNAIRVLFEGNLLEYVWGGFTQVGYQVLLTPKSQAGACPLCQVSDITVRFNKMSHSGSGISLANVPAGSGALGGPEAKFGGRYSLHDNTVDDINITMFKGSGGPAFQILSAWKGSALCCILINHNTTFPDLISGRIIGLGGYNEPPNNFPAMYNFTFTNNITGIARYAIWSTGGGTQNCASPNQPLASLNACFPGGYTFTNNAQVAQSQFPPNVWPTGNFFPATPAAIQFTNYNNGNGGNYQLLPSSPFHNAGLDGKDLGADIVTLNNILNTHTVP